ncbi:hypothetical protein FACS1894159_09810 [Bacteroidia bacterium]|nr:hypothetical protein FACS1894159_09810 [Bacteroidia bacterium]
MRKLFLTLAAALLLAACDDIFEKDISRAEVTVTAPANEAQLPEGKVMFRWETVERAQGYHLIVVSPTFAEAVVVVADTLLIDDSVRVHRSFACTLGQGDYQWSIRAFNSVYGTTESVRTLHVIKEEL